MTEEKLNARARQRRAGFSRMRILPQALTLESQEPNTQVFPALHLTYEPRMKLLMCLHCKFIPADKSDSHL